MNPNAENIIRARTRQLGITLGEVAHLAEISRPYLHRLLKGDIKNPGINTICHLAHALQMSPMNLCMLFFDESVSQVEKQTAYQNTHNSEDRAMFVSNNDYPDYTVVRKGEQFTKTWTIKNTGTTPWVNRRLVRVDDNLLVCQRTPAGQIKVLEEMYLASMVRNTAIAETPAGGSVDISVQFGAPTQSCSVASIWRIADDTGAFCYGEDFLLKVVITVVA